MNAIAQDELLIQVGVSRCGPTTVEEPSKCTMHLSGILTHSKRGSSINFEIQVNEGRKGGETITLNCS